MTSPRRSSAQERSGGAEQPPGDPEGLTSLDPEEYVELVLSVVESIPWGRVTSYGAIAGVVGGGPRQVGAVMARHGGPVPWWRVVRADGSLPPSHEDNARPHYLDEDTPLRGSGAVDMARAFWDPAPIVLPEIVDKAR